MINNDILRRVRYIFNFGDSRMIAIFALGELEVSRSELSDWLKRDDDPAYKECPDEKMAAFLNGLIVDMRGPKEDGSGVPKPEKRLNNNIILMKLKIALNLKSDDLQDIMKHAGIRFSKHEFSAFFRRPGHKHFRECKDQVLRNFLKGLQLIHRP